MGQRLTSIPNPDGPLLKLRMELACDGEHGLLPGDTLVREGDDYIAMRTAATRAGWRRSPPGKWLGPCCGANVH